MKMKNTLYKIYMLHIYIYICTYIYIYITYTRICINILPRFNDVLFRTRTFLHATLLSLYPRIVFRKWYHSFHDNMYFVLSFVFSQRTTRFKAFSIFFSRRTLAVKRAGERARYFVRSCAAATERKNYGKSNEWESMRVCACIMSVCTRGEKERRIITSFTR